jgi:drug/metabolite transporter (DMT)-like permease
VSLSDRSQSPVPRELTPREVGAGIAAVILAVTGFSWGFIIVKAVPLPPPVIAVIRLAIGAGVLTVVAVALRLRWPMQWGWVLGAGLAFGAHQLLYMGATKLTSIAIVALVAACQPLLVALVSRRVVGEPVSPRLLGCAVLAVAGVAVVVHANLGDQTRSLAGDLLAVVNAVVFTTYFLLAKRARMDGAPTVTFTASFLWVAAVVVAPALLFAGGEARLPGLAELGLIAVLALGPGNGHLLVNWAHRRVSAAMSSIILASVPLLSSLWAHLVLDEPYTWRHLAGMALVVLAIEGGRRADAATRRLAAEAEAEA